MAKIDHTLTFLPFLQSFRRGQLLNRIDDEMERVIAAMAETGGDGELTIRLPFKMNKAGQIECTPKVTSKVPQPAIGAGIFFADDAGRLTRRDPNQMDIEDEIQKRRDLEAAE